MVQLLLLWCLDFHTLPRLLLFKAIKIRDIVAFPFKLSFSLQFFLLHDVQCSLVIGGVELCPLGSSSLFWSLFLFFPLILLAVSLAVERTSEEYDLRLCLSRSRDWPVSRTSILRMPLSGNADGPVE